MYISRTLHKPEVTEGDLIVLLHSMNNKKIRSTGYSRFILKSVTHDETYKKL